MIVRISGAVSGLREYLETGRMQGREATRDELDDRVILSGSLDLFDVAVSARTGKGDRYLHITLSFMEDEVDIETLRHITRRLESFIFAAYRSEEYVFYAEAHLPRRRSYRDQKTGGLVTRLPHIHIGIPRYNPVTGGTLNPLGRVLNNIRWIDAWQEEMNREFGLESPKDHRRIALTGKSEMIARYSGSEFTGQGKAFKAELLEEVLARDIRDLPALADLLALRGEVRTRNAGTQQAYLNVRLHGEEKGINLKDHVFSPSFLSLAAPDKIRTLAAEPAPAYREPRSQKPSNPDDAGLVDEWMRVRAREVRWLDSSRKAEYRAYQDGTPQQREEILARRESAYYEGLRRRRAGLESGTATDASPATREQRPEHLLDRSIADEERVRDAAEIEAVTPVSRAGQVVRNQFEQDACGKGGKNALVQEAKRGIDARLMLEGLRKSHGVEPSKYPVEFDRNGATRIVCGTRRLNVADFLTKELHLPWSRAADVLCSMYARQVESRGASHDPETRERWAAYRELEASTRTKRRGKWSLVEASMAARFREARSEYLADKKSLYGDQTLSRSRRQAALSRLRMAYLARQEEIRLQSEDEARRLAVDEKRSIADSLDASFLAETERAGQVAVPRNEKVASPGGQETRPSGIMGIGIVLVAVTKRHYRGLKAKEGSNGSVDYYAGPRLLLRDSPGVVWMFQDDEDTVEIGLRMALLKFGPNLHVFGSDRFKELVVAVALHADLSISLDNDALQRTLDEGRAQKAERMRITEGAGMQYSPVADARGECSPGHAQAQPQHGMEQHGRSPGELAHIQVVSATMLF